MQDTPRGITTPTPGLDKEEPDFWIEDDIPSDDGGDAAEAKSERTGSSEERSPHKPERE